MKIAFVAQPIDVVIPPHQNSIGIIIYEIGRRVARDCSVAVYMKGKDLRKKVEFAEEIQFRHIPIGADRRILRALSRVTRCLFPKRPLFASKWYYLGYILQVALDLRRERFDIVHVVNFSQFIPIIRAFNPGISIVLHMECEWLTQFDKSEVERRLRKTDVVIGCSNFITNDIRDRFPFSKNICHTVHNGVDTDLFTSGDVRAKPKKDTKHRLLFVGRGSPEKGLHVLLDALRIIITDDPSVQLQMVGSFGSTPPKEFIVSVSDDPKVRDLESYYDGDYRSILNSKLSSGLVDHVELKGVIPYVDEPAQYRSSDVFVFPSVWHEPFGMPVIEAMSCGLPVVSTRSGGITELVEDGKTGLLVERGDSQMLADAIMRLLRDEPLRQLMGEAGRKRVLEHFTWDRIAEDFLTLYKRLYFEQV